MASEDKILPPIPAHTDECYPGLGRNAGYLQGERQESGGLDDSPGDLVEKAPFKQTQGGR